MLHYFHAPELREHGENPSGEQFCFFIAREKEVLPTLLEYCLCKQVKLINNINEEVILILIQITKYKSQLDRQAQIQTDTHILFFPILTLTEAKGLQSFL